MISQLLIATLIVATFGYFQGSQKIKKIERGPASIQRINLSGNKNGCFKDFNRSEIKPSKSGVKKVRIAIIDTGIDLANPCLTKRIEPDKDGVRSVKSFASRMDSGNDYNGHGSHIASIILGINPEAKIIPIKFEENPSLDYYLQALEYAISKRPDIINISISGDNYNKREDELLEKAKELGVTVIVAAGNNAKNIDEMHEIFPASLHHENMITVSAVTKTGDRLPMANYGQSKVDFFAPGESVKGYSANGQIQELSGTSQATAYVSGIVSRLYQDGKTDKEILSFLKKASISKYGSQHGSINEYLLLKLF